MHGKLLDALDGLYAAASISAFQESALAAAELFFPAAMIAYHDVPLVGPRESSHVCKDRRIDAGLKHAWRKHALQSPVVRYYRDGGTDPVIATQDLTTQRQLRDSALFHECWKPFGVTHQIGLRIWSTTRVSGLSIKRDGKFSDDDKRLLKALHPHVVRASSALQSLPAHRPDELKKRLTPSELDVLRLVASGKRNRDIAALLNNSPRTIERHVENILGKLGVHTRGAASCLFHASRL